MKELYSEMILRYARSEEFRGKIEDALEAEDRNESCGDEVKLYIKVQDGIVKDASFEGRGCIVSMASSAMMIEAIRGKSLGEIKRTVENIERMMRGEEFDEEAVGNAVVFSGISGIPARSKCFYLPWSVLKGVLKSIGEG